MDVRLVGLTLQEAVDMLEDDNAQFIDAIYMEPPDAREISDEDSVDEDFGGVPDNLSGHQLRARSEVVTRVPITDDNATGIEDPDPPVTTKPASKKKKKTALQWERKDLTQTEPVFPDSNTAQYREKTAVEIFEMFFTDDIFNLLVEECNKYATYQNASTSFVNVTIDEMRVWIALIILSGYNIVPTKRSYWEDKGDVHNVLAASSMRRNRFLEICRYMHLAENAKPDLNDRLWKLRPLLEKFKEIFKKLYVPEKNLSYDEAMIKYFGKHGCKQFIRGKPVRFGYKVWSLNTPRGYLIDFEIYQGKSRFSNDEYESTYGKCAAPLLSMIDNLPENVKSLPMNFYFDNLFTGFPLLVELKRRGYGSTGTMRENRIPNDCPLLSSKAMKNEPRGSFHYSLCVSDDIVVAKWKDNAIVTAASTSHGIEPIKQVSRYSKATKKRVNVPRPNIFGKYNESMGGTDRMDQNVNCHRIATRNRKFWWPIFTWILDVAIVNAWIISSHTGKDWSQLEFRRLVVQTYLVRYGKASQQGRRIHVGREAEMSLRYDGFHHYIAPVGGNGRRRCQGEYCTSVINSQCVKCNVGLCVKCFLAYHTL